MIKTNKIYQGDSLKVLETFLDEYIDCVVTSPPYWGLRDYGVENQIGLEKTPEEYVGKMTVLFREIKRVLKPSGTVWLNLGDSYVGGGRGNDKKYGQGRDDQPKSFKGNGNLKTKDLVGIPWRVAFSLQADGWYLRQDIIWHKPNPMPESVKDRCTKAHEYIFLLTKSPKYFFDSDAIAEEATGYDGRKDTKYKGGKKDMAGGPHERWRKRKAADTNYGTNGNGFKNHSGYDILENPYIRNKRSIWTVPTKPFSEAHFAVYPPELIAPCIKAGCPVGGIVLDPFMGAGTTAYVARKLGREYIGIELNQDYIEIANRRLQQNELPFYK